MDDKPSAVYEFGPYRLDAAARLLLRGGAPVPLKPKAFTTLLHLVERRGQVVGREELMAAVWPNAVVEENNLDQQISALRKSLGDNRADVRYIVTIPGEGFTFVGQVQSGQVQSVGQVQSDAEIQSVGEVDIVVEGVDVASETPSRETTPETSRERPRSRTALWSLIAALVAVVIAALSLGERGFARDPDTTRIRSIAVLPFRPLLPGERNEALELGMADTLISKLSNIREITVRPISSVRRYTSLDQDPLAAGRELQVDAVVDSTIRRWGDRIRVTTRLIRTEDGRQMWENRYDEPAGDVFAIEDSISAKVVDELALELSEQEEERVASRETNSLDAYHAYVLGRFHWSRRTPDDVRKAIRSYQRATAIDPAYALAYAGIADAYMGLPISSDVRPSEAFPQAKAAAQKALELDPGLAEGAAALGTVAFWYDWNWAAAERWYRRALTINPKNVSARHYYAHLLSNLGRHDEAMTEIRRARDIDPSSVIVNTHVGQFLFQRGDSAGAVRELQNALTLDPTFWIAHIALGKVHQSEGRYDQAMAEYRLARQYSGGNSEALALIAVTHAARGEREEARAILDELSRAATQKYVPAYNLASVHAALGEDEEALALLARACRDRDARMTFLNVDRKWDRFRGDPRFDAILDCARLPRRS